MHQPEKRRGRLLKAALAVFAIGSGAAVQTVTAAPLAIEKAAAKKAQREKEAAAAAAAEEQKKAAEAAAKESLSFDPFLAAPAPAASAPAAAAPAPAAEPAASEAAKRIAARDAVLTKMATIHEGFLQLLGSARANRRSPNSPPPFTPRRPSDPPGPPPNVPPGPPQHAPPGRPPGVGNGAQNAPVQN